MYWQREVFRASKEWVRGQTMRQELPDHGLLGAIMFHVRTSMVTSGQQTMEKFRLMDWINELKVVGNGNRVLKSITGQVGHFIQWLDGGQLNLDVHTNYGGGMLRHHGLLTFGRKLFDVDYGLDLAAWDGVELQFKNDSSATYHDEEFTIDLILYWLREASSGQFKGWFKTEEYRKWTTVSDAWEYVGLPTEGLLRRLILQVQADRGSTYHEALTTLYNVAYEIALKLRSGTVEMWNSGLRDLWYDNAFMLGRDPITAIQPYHSDSYAFPTGLSQAFGSAGARLEHSGTQVAAPTALIPGDDGETYRRETDLSIDQDSMLIAGIAPESCALFPFDLENDPSKYLDLDREKTVTLDVHTRSGANYDDGTIRVILDRLIRGQGPIG